MRIDHHSVSVLITSYQRPAYLAKCIESLSCQSTLPSQILIVARPDDIETLDAIADAQRSFPNLPIELATVNEPGVIAANNVGFGRLTGDIVAFLDDDSTAPKRWIKNLTRHYQDPGVGAVGGRIINHRDDTVLYQDRKFTTKCQRIDRFGRPFGGQMYPFDGTWDVESLTGSNMSFRRSLLANCDEQLFGDGFRYEMDLCLLTLASGYRVLLDSDAVNEHWCAPRKEGPQRKDPRVVEANSRHNEDYVLAKHGRGTWWVLLRRLVVRFPKDLGWRLTGKPTYPVRYLASSLRGWYRGFTVGRQIRQKQISLLGSNRVAG